MSNLTEMQRVASYIIISVFMLTSSAVVLIPVIRGVDVVPYVGLLKEYGVYHSGLLMMILGYLFAQGRRTAGETELATVKPSEGDQSNGDVRHDTM